VEDIGDLRCFAILPTMGAGGKFDGVKNVGHGKVGLLRRHTARLRGSLT
jgi:hypothetical protein